MGFDLVRVAGMLSKILTVIPLAVRAVEILAGRAGDLKGKQKQDAAVAIVVDAVAVTEAIVGRDLLRDEEIDTAMRAVIDAIVALQNIVTSKAAARI
jgi:hypothetical protein